MTYEYTNLNLKDEPIEVEVTIEVYDLRVCELRVSDAERASTVFQHREGVQDIEFRHREGAIQ